MVKCNQHDPVEDSSGWPADGQKNSIRLRHEVRLLYFKRGYSKNEICRLLGVSKGFVVRWTQSDSKELGTDNRGWRSGVGRRWDEVTWTRVRDVHQELMNDEREFFTGATAIQQRYQRRYPGLAVPPLRTIGRMLKQMGLSTRRPGKQRGAARYLCYPEHTIYEQLGERVLEADFIGRKFLAGQQEPLNFIGFSFKRGAKLRYFQRVEAQTADTVISMTRQFFTAFERPDVMKFDNDPATVGTGSGKRSLSRFMVFLLQEQVTPVFSVPRKPFSQASIEGNNSVFARKFWNTRMFQSVADVDEQLEWFNQSSINYTGYQKPAAERARDVPFQPRIYFIRQVQQDETSGKGYISVMNEKVAIRKNYIKYFVLAEWDLATEQLNVLFEKNNKARRIKSVDFPVNPNSRYKLN